MGVRAGGRCRRRGPAAVSGGGGLHLPGGQRQLAAEVLAVAGIVELGGVEVVGQDAAMRGSGMHHAGIERLDLAEDIGMNPGQVGFPPKGQFGLVRRDKEDGAVAAGVRPHGGEYGLEGVVEGGGKEIAAFVQAAKAVDNQRSTGAEHAADGGEGFPREQVRGRAVAQEGVENDGVILAAAAVQEVAAIVKGEVDLVGLQVEEANGDRHHRGVDSTTSTRTPRWASSMGTMPTPRPMQRASARRGV